jgi:uncharacterized membrane protein YdjX (TVP38/TMEM64 family)
MLTAVLVTACFLASAAWLVLARYLGRDRDQEQVPDTAEREIEDLPLAA